MIWDQIGGNSFLRRAINTADRFVRLSCNLTGSPKYKGRDMAVAAVFSLLRAIGVPLGTEDRNHPSISAVLWRAISDHHRKRYHFESTIKPAVCWADLDRINLEPGAAPKMIEGNGRRTLADGASGEIEPAVPFEWMAPRPQWTIPRRRRGIGRLMKDGVI